MNKDALAIRDNLMFAAAQLKRKVTNEEYELLMRYARGFELISENSSDYKTLPPVFRDDMQAGYFYSDGIVTAKDRGEVFRIIGIAESKLAKDLREHNYQPKIIEYKERSKSLKRKVD